MNSKRWIALIAAGGLLVFSLGLNTVISFFKADFLSSFDSMLATDGVLIEEVPLSEGDWNKRIALLTVNGTILDVGSSTYWETVEYDHQAFLSSLDSILQDETVEGVVLQVNSPGGGVIESADIHEKLVQIKEERQIPIYVSMGSYAASGGYYIAAPGDKIYAQKETITGSIGVIMQSYNFEKLAEKVGIEFETIKSGAHKDMFGGTRASTEEEKAMLQEMINESYQDFFNVVIEGRQIPEAELKKVADGRILSGTQAMRAGLVDEIGGVENAIASLRKDHNLEDAQLFEYSTGGDSFANLLAAKVGSFFGPSEEERLIQQILTTSNSPRMLYLYGDY